MPSSFGDHKLSKHLLKHYARPFSNKSAVAFANSLLNDQHWFEELWNMNQRIINKPTLFIRGLKDPVIKPHHLHKFQKGFTNSNTVVLDSCGHFLQKEQPDKVAEAMTGFIR